MHNLPRFLWISRKAKLREDTTEVLGIVSGEYEVVDNRDAFRFLDALIGSELHFETAGSLWGGRRVWCLARLSQYVELGYASYLHALDPVHRVPPTDLLPRQTLVGERLQGSCFPCALGTIPG